MTTETLTTPVETVTPIKPSEALRLGRLVRPLEVPDHPFTGTTGACAIGAMALGWGFDPDDDLYVYGFVESHLPLPTVEADKLTEDIFGAFDGAPEGHRDAVVLALLEERGL